MKVPLFVELCAGLASVSGVLEHGSMWKPPVSRMGRKTGYAGAILRIMGLRPRQRAERYLWAEADGDVAALLAAYTQPEVMREIAETIRSWIPCPYGPHAPDPSCCRCKGTGRWDARDLWEVLRREERRGLWEGGGGVGEVAGWLYEHSRSDTIGKFADEEDGRPRGGWRGNGPGRRGLADRVEGQTWPPVLLAQSAHVGVGEVAGWAALAQGCYRRGFPESGFDDEVARGRRPFVEVVANEWPAAHLWPPVALTPDARIDPPAIPPGTVVYMDPPYSGTTGYKHDLGRNEVIAIAERWKDAGARVYISEAEPIPIKGWHHVEITGERIGQARTFGATREWLTCSHPPARRQVSLFGRAA